MPRCTERSRGCPDPQGFGCRAPPVYREGSGVRADPGSFVITVSTVSTQALLTTEVGDDRGLRQIGERLTSQGQFRLAQPAADYDLRRGRNGRVNEHRPFRWQADRGDPAVLHACLGYRDFGSGE